MQDFYLYLNVFTHGIGASTKKDTNVLASVNISELVVSTVTS